MVSVITESSGSQQRGSAHPETDPFHPRPNILLQNFPKPLVTVFAKAFFPTFFGEDSRYLVLAHEVGLLVSFKSYLQSKGLESVRCLIKDLVIQPLGYRNLPKHCPDISHKAGVEFHCL